jgi:hypothetical protein
MNTLIGQPHMFDVRIALPGAVLNLRIGVYLDRARICHLDAVTIAA